MLKCLELAEKEYERSNKLYPMFHSTHEGYAVIKEELDELWDYIKESKVSTPDVMQRAEVIQIMAMCLKMSKLSPGFNLFDIVEYEYQQNIKINSMFNSTHEGYAYILRWSDDLWRRVVIADNCLTNNSRTCLVQIVVMCIKFMESWPEEK